MFSIFLYLKKYKINKMRKLLLLAVLTLGIGANAQTELVKGEKPIKTIEVSFFGANYASTDIYVDYVVLSLESTNQYAPATVLLFTIEDYKTLGAFMTNEKIGKDDMLKIKDMTGVKALAFKATSGMGFKTTIAIEHYDGTLSNIPLALVGLPKKQMKKLFDIQ
jgi:hypothetical protein